MKLAILSVPHTGTNFITQLFGAPTPVDIGKIHHGEDHEVISCHVGDPVVFEWALANGYTIVSPMRDPFTTLRSWVQWAHHFDSGSREELIDLTDPEEIETWRKAIDPQMLFHNLECLVMGDQLYDIDFLPVDSLNRQSSLEEFNKKHGMSLETSWSPRNSIGKHDQSVPEELIKKMSDFLEENRRFFNKFLYTSQIHG